MATLYNPWPSRQWEPRIQPGGGVLLVPTVPTCIDASAAPYGLTDEERAACERVYARCIDDLLWPEFSSEEIKRLQFYVWMRLVLEVEEGIEPVGAFVPVD